MIIAPMAETGEEPIGSMGNDTPLAVLSEEPQLLFAYFRQQFAQVTNPPIDSIREQLVMSLRTWLGPQRNLLDEAAGAAHQIQVNHPVLTASGIAALRTANDPMLQTVTLPALFSSTAPECLTEAVDALCASALAAVHSGCGILILSDRPVDATHAPIPSLLAVSAVHHHLIREGCRARVSLVIETGDARDVSHLALLLSYGAGAVHPYLALASCAGPAAQANYVKAAEKGLLKILSKMGVSTVQGYCGAQLWEAVGLDRAMVQQHFTGTASPLSGVGLDIIAEDVLRRHAIAFASPDDALLDAGSEHHYRMPGERHAWNPLTIATLQRAAREESVDTYREFSRLANDETRSGRTLRGMFDFVERKPVPLDEVEPAAAIVRRFVTGAMSFGSISAEAHETLAIAMNQIGGRSNTGEGGEDPARFGTARNSAIKQVASARFGVTAEYLVSAKELQIKMAQGAKPGEGGQLPGHKVDAMIARTRNATPGVTLISPPPHHDIYSIEDLKQLIYDLRNVNPTATVSVKLVAETGVGTVAAGVVKAEADLITISGDSGGTGASPLVVDQARGSPVGARPGRGATDVDAQRTARAGSSSGRRPAQDGSRRGGRLATRRGGVRLRDRAAHRARMRDDAEMSSQHVPGRHRDAGPGATTRNSPDARSISSTISSSSPKKCERSWQGSDFAPSMRWSDAPMFCGSAAAATRRRERWTCRQCCTRLRVPATSVHAAAFGALRSTWRTRSIAKCSTSSNRRLHTAKRSW